MHQSLQSLFLMFHLMVDCVASNQALPRRAWFIVHDHTLNTVNSTTVMYLVRAATLFYLLVEVSYSITIVIAQVGRDWARLCMGLLLQVDIKTSVGTAHLLFYGLARIWKRGCAAFYHRAGPPGCIQVTCMPHRIPSLSCSIFTSTGLCWADTACVEVPSHWFPYYFSP